MPNRDQTLARLSQLQVTSYVKLGVVYYVFGPRHLPMKSVCTYRKAKVFAEGVALGRRLGECV